MWTDNEEIEDTIRPIKSPLTRYNNPMPPLFCYDIATKPQKKNDFVL